MMKCRVRSEGLGVNKVGFEGALSSAQQTRSGAALAALAAQYWYCPAPSISNDPTRLVGMKKSASDSRAMPAM